MESIVPKQLWRNVDKNFIKILESNWYKAIFDLQNELSFATYDFYKEKRFKTVYLPITTGSISSPMGLGSDSLPVKVELCDQETYLADSMQFMLEYATRINKDNCFYIMPSFRGEKADERHLCQFYHSEAEILGKLDDVMDLVEEYVKFLSKRLLHFYEDTITRISGDTKHLQKILSIDKFPRIFYSDAVKMLSTIDGCTRVDEYGLTYITHKGEKKLIELNGGFVWLYKMDKRVVPFYQAVANEETVYAECADLLFGIGEVVGAGERHATGNAVRKALSEHRVPENSYDWYIKMKDELPLTTSGFGMGTERFLLWVLKHNDIRDCQLLPRFNGEKNYL